MRNEIKEIIESIKCAQIEARYIQADEVEIVIMDDNESDYHEVAVIQNDIVHFFGEPFVKTSPTITKEQYISNLKENWD